MTSAINQPLFFLLSQLWKAKKRMSHRKTEQINILIQVSRLYPKKEWKKWG